MKVYHYQNDTIRIEIIPGMTDPWATAYYGNGPDDHVTVENWNPKFYRRSEDELARVADLAAKLSRLLYSVGIPWEFLSEMCSLDNYETREPEPQIKPWMSTSFRGDHSTMDLELSKSGNTFSGYIVFAKDGKTYGPYRGGRYGIGTEWEDPDQAVTDLKVYATWQMEEDGIDDPALLDELLYGQLRRDRAHKKRTDAMARESEIDNLLAELEEGRIELADSIQELSGFEEIHLSEIHPMEPAPDAGTQLELFA